MKASVTKQGNGGIRQHNRTVLLEWIRTRGPLSRADLSRASRLSMATVLDIVEELEGEGLVEDIGEGRSTGGRRPTLVNLVADSRLVIGLEVGTETLTAVVANLTAEIKHRVSIPSCMSEGPCATHGQVKQALLSLGHDVLRDCHRCLGIGVALPAPVVRGARNPCFSPPSYPDWGQLSITDTVAEITDLPVAADNDANARAVGEHLFGACTDFNNAFYIVCHHGIGGAAIMDGSLRKGANGAAGEIGHTVIDPNGPLCGCGQNGCLEAFAGHMGIVHQVQQLLRSSGDDGILGSGIKEAQAPAVIDAALAGHRIAQQALRNVGTYLGIGIANITKVFDPAIIILGGPTMKAEEFLMDPIKQQLKQRSLYSSARMPAIAVGGLKEDAGAIGAAALVLRQLFRFPASV